jgi:quinol monooxygenase YgiN
MILTTIKVHGQTAKRKEIIQTIRELAGRMTEDKGCLKANLYMDLEDKDTLYFMEEWRTRSDLEKYKNSKSLTVLLGLESLLVEGLEIKHAVKCESVESDEQ